MSKKKTEEESISVEPIIAFFKNRPKMRQGIVIAILILIAMFCSIYFRSYPATLPIADQWAEDGILSNVRSQIAASVNQQYPNLPADRKQEIVEEELQKFIKEQQAAIDEQTKLQAEYIREEFRNEDNQTYLLAIDPYYYYRQTKNVVDHGYGADIIKDGVKWNTHRLAPLGEAKPRDEYHEIISAGVYKTVRAFDRDAELFNVFFWMPVIISALAVIPAFFIARKRAGNLGGFIAAMIVAVSIPFLGRTPAGFADTDAYNVTFPLLIFWAFLEAFETKDLKKKLILSGITGLLVGVYSRTWGGWWYIFDFMLVVMIAYLGFSIVRSLIKEKDFFKAIKKEDVKNAAISFIVILVSSGVFVSIARSFKDLFIALLNPLRFTTIQNAANTNLWPNVFTTVAELNKASLSTIVSQIGGSIYFYLACLGVIITMVSAKKIMNKDWAILGTSAIIYLFLISKPMLTGNPYLFLALLLLPVAIGLILLLKDDRGIDVKYSIFLGVWFVGTIYASTQGIRFILLLVPAYAIAFGILIGQLYRIITNWSKRQFDMPQAWLKAGLIILSLLILIRPIGAAHQAALHEVPSMNDDWWASLDKINQEGSPDALITSWWDFGHWFKAIADRPVTFDGASQNTPMAHWVGKALSTDEEQRAVGILRMLDCGSNSGYDLLARAIQGTDQKTAIKPETTIVARELMASIILTEEDEEARVLLEEAGIEDEEVQDKILSLSHCEPPEAFLITSSDMIGKASVWGHFGAWDFRKAYVYNVLIEQTPDQATPIISELFNITNKEAGQLYYEAFSLESQQAANTWISPWPQYLTSSAIACKEENRTVTCPVNRNIGSQQGQNIRLENAVIDLDSPEATIIGVGFYSQQNGQKMGETTTEPIAVTIGEGEELEKTPMDEAGIAFEIFLVKQGSAYKAVIASPELATSMFTRLYFLDGAYTERFEKFSDRTNPVTGDRIIVWKVRW